MFNSFFLISLPLFLCTSHKLGGWSVTYMCAPSHLKASLLFGIQLKQSSLFLNLPSVFEGRGTHAPTPSMQISQNLLIQYLGSWLLNSIFQSFFLITSCQLLTLLPCKYQTYTSRFLFHWRLYSILPTLNTLSRLLTSHLLHATHFPHTCQDCSLNSSLSLTHSPSFDYSHFAIP